MVDQGPGKVQYKKKLASGQNRWRLTACREFQYIGNVFPSSGRNNYIIKLRENHHDESRIQSEGLALVLGHQSLLYGLP